MRYDRFRRYYGLIMKKTGWHWVGDYALPMSLILGMASAIPITGWLS